MKRPASDADTLPTKATKRVFRLTPAGRTPAGQTPAGRTPASGAQIKRMEDQISRLVNTSVNNGGRRSQRTSTSSPEKRPRNNAGKTPGKRRNNAGKTPENRRNNAPPVKPHVKAHYASANANPFFRDLVSYVPFVDQAVKTPETHDYDVRATTRWSEIHARTSRGGYQPSLRIRATRIASGKNIYACFETLPQLHIVWRRNMVLQSIRVHLYEYEVFGLDTDHLNQVYVFATLYNHPKPHFKPAVCEFFSHVFPAYLKNSPLRGPVVDVLLNARIVESVCQELISLPFPSHYFKEIGPQAPTRNVLSPSLHMPPAM